ncbi:MAG: TerB family tellurite resistance protein [Pseudomonadota bacterium]
MRHYPRNSPQAAGRILALALLSDGHLSRRELDVLDRLDAHTALGLGRTELHSVVHSFCEDLLTAMHLSWGDACQVDQATLAALMADIDEPALRHTLLRLCLAIVDADAHLAEGESVMLAAAVTHWGLHPDLLALRTAPAA